MKSALRNRVVTADEPVKNEPSANSESGSIEQATLCRVCGRPTSNRSFASNTIGSPSNLQSSSTFRFSTNQENVLCEACKKFYCRYRNKIQEEKCLCGDSATPAIDKCRLCRYQKCEAALLEKSSIASGDTSQLVEGQLPEKIDFATLPCAVCGCSSSGFHFGVVSCEGCKGFFRRSMNQTFKIQYKCNGKKEGDPQGESDKALCPRGSNCRKCRFQRCLDAGMSLKGIAIGRHTVRRRAEIDATLRKHSAEGSFLRAKLLRRQRPTSENGVSQAMVSPSPSSSFVKTDSQYPDSVIVTPATKPFSDDDSDNGSDNGTIPVKIEVASSSCQTEEEVVNVASLLLTSQSTQTDDPLACEFSENGVEGSWEWLIERAVEGSARLAPISALRLRFSYEMTIEERRAERSKNFDNYVKCISEFLVALPGFRPLSLSDRVILFTQAFFPISSAQLSLDFDVARQIPNHFSHDREGQTWEIVIRDNPQIFSLLHSYLCEVGNLFCSTIFNAKEFSLCCALLFFNPDTPSLENVESVRSVRKRYEMAAMHYFYTVSGAEERLAKFYQLLGSLRRATLLFHDFFSSIDSDRPNTVTLFTPLFKQLFWQLVRLPPGTPSPST